MRALVVYESIFGNTRTVAEAVAAGLAGRMSVETVEVGVAPAEVPEGVRLLVVGGPTHALGLSRPGTRQDAARQSVQPPVSGKVGLREWLATLPASAGVSAAAFDTRIDKPRVPGSAARAATKRLRKLGFHTVVPPASFYVEDSRGPLLPGEAERARAWAEKLGADLPVQAGSPRTPYRMASRGQPHPGVPNG